MPGKFIAGRCGDVDEGGSRRYVGDVKTVDGFGSYALIVYQQNSQYIFPGLRTGSMAAALNLGDTATATTI